MITLKHAIEIEATERHMREEGENLKRAVEEGKGWANGPLNRRRQPNLFSNRNPVNAAANSSKLAIGQERDAINHPGRESFDGELARFLMYERPLTKDELGQTMESLKKAYAIP